MSDKEILGLSTENLQGFLQAIDKIINFWRRLSISEALLRSEKMTYILDYERSLVHTWVVVHKT